MGDHENNLIDATENNAALEPMSESINDSIEEPITNTVEEPVTDAIESSMPEPTTVESTEPIQNINNSVNSETPLDTTPPSSAPLVLGILSFLGVLIPLAGYILSIFGIVISVKDKKKINSKYGNLGLILSIIALALSFIMHIINIMILSSYIR